MGFCLQRKFCNYQLGKLRENWTNQCGFDELDQFFSQFKKCPDFSATIYFTILYCFLLRLKENIRAELSLILPFSLDCLTLKQNLHVDQTFNWKKSYLGNGKN